MAEMTDTDSDVARIYPCQQCGKTVKWSPDNMFRPFCSERCKLIDLGEWAAEKHAIPGNTSDDEFD
jgi:endogenous inhibitor of DNA gyrase (YacG/DUF329 family)